MKCFKCYKKWVDNADTKTGICPHCGENILHLLQHQPRFLPTSLTLYSVFSLVGLDLSETEIIRSVISNLFSYNTHLRYMLLLTYEHMIPHKIKSVEDLVELEVSVIKINRFLIEELQFSDSDADQITHFWRCAFGKERCCIVRRNLKFDSLFEVVARYVVSIQKSSTVLIQQKFQISYNRCSLMSDQLEKVGVTSPYNKTEFREVKVKDQSILEELLRSL